MQRLEFFTGSTSCCRHQRLCRSNFLFKATGCDRDRNTYSMDALDLPHVRPNTKDILSKKVTLFSSKNLYPESRNGTNFRKLLIHQRCRVVQIATSAHCICKMEFVCQTFDLGLIVQSPVSLCVSTVFPASSWCHYLRPDVRYELANGTGIYVPGQCNRLVRVCN